MISSPSFFHNLHDYFSWRTTSFLLPNGLSVFLEEDHRAPVACVQAWCATGSIHEGKWLGAGLSHLLEHMLFKGTSKRPPGVIAQEVQQQGGYMNAYTSFDRTVYWINGPSAGVTAFIEILADAMMNATLRADEYVKEQEVIRREHAMVEDHPEGVLQKLLFRTIYSVSPFAQPILGHLDIYNQLTRDDVAEYYQKRYLPNNIGLVIVGDINPRAIEEQLTHFFEGYPRKPQEPVLIEKEPKQVGLKVERQTFATELSRLNMAWRGPGNLDPRAPATEVLMTILGSGASSLFHQEIREKKQLAHQVGAGFYGLNAEEGLIYVGASAHPSKRAALEAEIIAQVQKVLERGVEEEELEKAKNILLATHFSSLTTVQGRASNYVSNLLETGNPHFGRDYLSAIGRVTLHEVKSAAAAYFLPEGLTIVSLDPKVKSTDLTTTMKKQRREERKVERVLLSSGLRLLICEDHSLPLISIAAMFRGGLLGETRENNGISDLLTSTLSKGTKRRSAENIARTIEQVGASLGATAGNNSLFFSIDHIMTPHLRLGLHLFAELLEEATFPPHQVDHEKEVQLAALESEEDQILTVARKILKEKLFGDHPYARPLLGTPETVTSLNSRMLEQFRDEMIVGHNGVLAIFGDVRRDEVLEMAQKAFATIPSGTLQFSSTSAPRALREPVRQLSFREKKQAVLLKGFLTAPLSSPHRPALELLDSACSDLGSRFFNRIREQEALAYYAGGSLSMGLAAGSFTFYLGTDPEKLGDASRALNDEINLLLEEGLTEEELSRAKKKILGEEAIAIQSIAGFASRCLSEELLGLGFEHYRTREVEINEVTLEYLHEVIKEYFTARGSVEIALSPREDDPLFK